MYLSIMHPEVLPYVRELAKGLRVVVADELVLVIKTRKEIILTARERREFKLYLAPCLVEGRRGLTLISAFFDDPVSPLTITTPLATDDPLVEAVKNLPNQFKVCFFDEHDRELLSCEAHAKLDDFRLRISNDPLLGLEHSIEMLDQGDAWFSRSTAADDALATSVYLGADLFPSNYVITDMTEQGFRGWRGFSTSQLERLEPGCMQEMDIIYLLKRCYPSDRIIHSPVKISDGQELVDLLIMGDEVSVLLQAKDSPNTINALNTTLERKQRKAVAQLKQGLSQVRGALSTIRRERNLGLKLLSGEELTVDLNGKPIVGVVIVKELFKCSYDEYGRHILDFMERFRIPALVFDYAELDVMTRHCPSESALLAAFHQIFEHVRDQGNYPRLRFSTCPPD